MSESGKNIEKQGEISVKSKLTIATVGSKNRVCLPPQTCSHMNIEQGDHLAFVLKHTKKDNKPYAQLVNVKAKNFEVEDETVETIDDAIK